MPALSRPRIRMRISLEDQRRREKRERAPPILDVVVVLWFCLEGRWGARARGWLVGCGLECLEGWRASGVGIRLVDCWVVLGGRVKGDDDVSQTLVFQFLKQIQMYEVRKTACAA